ncbi:MAG: cell division protein FtsZ [bacterium]|nr:cell division protein FtsZ [bacterium]
MTIHLKTPDLEGLTPKIAVIGVGGAGGNAVNNMIAAKLHGVSFIVANTDAQALVHSNAETKIQLGASITEGLGAGSKPEIGAAAAEESIEEIRSHLKDLHMVFITAGMGGGTGTGAAPVIAAAARAEGVLTVGVVTKPFHFEGQRRMRSAEFGVELLFEQVDTLIVIPNQNLFRVAVMKTTFSEAFAMADQVLHDGISCITDVMVKEGIINLDFADVNLVMRDSGKAMMGTGDADGENRGREAADAAISNPLLDDVSLQGAHGLLVSIIGGHDDLTLYEVDEAANRVREEVASNANIIIGTAFDETLDGSIKVSVVATGLDEAAQRMASAKPQPETAGAAEPVANEGSLQDRLGSINTAHVASPPAPHHPGALADPPVSPMCYEDQTARMPTMEDFPPVGQALLREREEGHVNQNVTLGLAAYKEGVGFLDRLAGLLSGRRAQDIADQTVAQQPQPKVQSARGLLSGSAGSIDPHSKGGALSSQSMSANLTTEEDEEVTEFPSFLRK